MSASGRDFGAAVARANQALREARQIARGLELTAATEGREGMTATWHAREGAVDAALYALDKVPGIGYALRQHGDHEYEDVYP